MFKDLIDVTTFRDDHKVYVVRYASDTANSPALQLQVLPTVTLKGVWCDPASVPQWPLQPSMPQEVVPVLPATAPLPQRRPLEDLD